MDEIISSILEAEKKADEIVKNSTENAKNILLISEQTSEKIKEDAVASFKAHRKEVLSASTKEADKKYEKRIIDGEEEAKKKAKSVEGKIEELADEIVREILK